jgi:hypothetical protein
MNFVRTVVVFALLNLVPSAQSQESSPQAPQIKSQEQSESRLEAEQSNDQKADRRQESMPGAKEIGSESGQRKGYGDSGESGEQGTEFWPPFYGYRLKVTDTLLVAVTFLLFWATLALWLSTRRLVKDAKRTAARQLRAYVNVANAVAKPDGDFFVYSIEVKNFGQTPAYKVRLRYVIELRECPTMRPFIVPDDPKISVAVLPPTVPIHDAFRPRQVLGPNQRQRLADGAAAIYIYGLITYEDIFESPQETEFRYMIGGNVGISPEGAVRICEEGNRAT